MAVDAQYTDFSLDVMGRFVANSFDEAQASRLGDGGPNGGASPFQIIIIGGGTFGGALAAALCSADRATFSQGDPYSHYASRILVLEAGPFFLPEHGQNIPLVKGIDTPPTETIASLRAQGKAEKPMALVWGLPWHSDDGFCGLAYCLGGRSLFWGGWSPRFLDSEMPTSKPNASVRAAVWPQAVKDDLQGSSPEDPNSYFNVAARHLGVSDPSDFINGGLHVAMRAHLFKEYGRIQNTIPLDELPLYYSLPAISDETMSLVAHASGAQVDAEKVLKLDAPYAVQTLTRPGFFPTNKWSSMPGLIAATRKAASDSQQSGDTVTNDSRKQLTVVPNCNVKKLVTQTVSAGGKLTRRVVGVETVRGTIPVPTNGVVVIALGAIESTRLALNSFGDVPFAGHMGQNLMMHLRSNTVFLVDRNHPAFAGVPWKELQVSAIQVRGRIKHQDGTVAHFHLQITASGVPEDTGNPEAQLFQKIPDIDQIESIDSQPRNRVAIAVRGIGEMESLNPGSSVQLDPEIDTANGMLRAFVRVNDDLKRDFPAIRNLTKKDADLKTAMVEATNNILEIFGAPRRTENSDSGAKDDVFIKLDGVGTTYHESGTLRMGEDPADSVTNPDQQFHQVCNAYVADMSVLPTCGSANPMQPGVALVRRLAKHLASPAVPKADTALFDGSTLKHWRMAGMNSNCFGLFDDRLVVLPAQGQLGLFYCLRPTPSNFELSLEWRVTGPKDNSGVFIRFPDPNRVPPGEKKGYDNPAYVAINYGFEVQVCGDDNGFPDNPDVNAAKFRRTGVFYNCPGQVIDESVPIDHNGGWNRMRITAVDQTYEVFFDYPDGTSRLRTRFINNGRTRFVTGIPAGNIPRGAPGTATAPSFIGLQTHFDTKEASFRNIRIKSL